MSKLKIKRIKIGNIPFHNFSLENLIEELDHILQTNEKVVLAFSNPEFVLESRRNRDLENYLNLVKFNLADGAGIILASKVLNKMPLQERITGTDFLPAITKLSHEKGYSLFFVGGKPGIAEKAKEKLEKVFPAAKIVGTQNGYFNSKEEDQVIQNINALEPDFLMVCLGNPLQEKWIAKNYDKLNAKVIFGNGGALDFWSSEVKRAPFWMQKHSLEWLYRLFQDFSRKRISRQTKLLKFPIVIFNQFISQKFQKI